MYLKISDGTLCDLNGLPRTTRVQYVCYPNGNHDIYSLKESSTCEYEVVVLSSLLCKKFIDLSIILVHSVEKKSRYISCFCFVFTMQDSKFFFLNAFKTSKN